MSQAQNALRERSESQGQSWRIAQELPCNLAVDVPVLDFRVRNLLTLAKGTILSTRSNQANDVPLRVNGRFVGWAEFELVADRLAVRITELA
jgi:flagellar motor switch/type III secretory pathway protein FliN